MTSTYSGLVLKALPQIRELAHQLENEIKQLGFHMHELTQALPYLPDLTRLSGESLASAINNMPGIDRLNRMAAAHNITISSTAETSAENTIGAVTGSYLDNARSYLSSLKEWASMPGIDQILKTDYSAPINYMLFSLDSVTHQHKSSISHTTTAEAEKFMPLNMPLQTLQSLILNKYGIETPKKHRYNINDSMKKFAKDPRAKTVNPDEVKNILIFHNALDDLQKTLQSMVNLAEGGSTLSGTYNVAASLHSILEKFNAISGSINPEIRQIVKELMEQTHPYLSHMAVRAEIAEIQFGIATGSIMNSVKSVCTNFESMADSYGARLGSRFPYTFEKIAPLQQEMRRLKQQKLDIDHLQDMLVLLNQPEFIKTSTLETLLSWKQAAELLPPSYSSTFIKGINEIIAKRTGLDVLESKLKSAQNSFMSNQNAAAEYEGKISALTAKNIELNNTKSSVQALLTQFQDASTERKPLTFEQIKFLHALKPTEPKNIEAFITMLYTKNSEAQNTIVAKLATIDQDINTNKDNIRIYGSMVLGYQTAANNSRDEIQKFEQRTAKLTQLLQNPHEIGGDFIKYDARLDTFIIQSTQDASDLKITRPDDSELKAAIARTLPDFDRQITALADKIRDYEKDIKLEYTALKSFFQEIEAAISKQSPLEKIRAKETHVEIARFAKADNLEAAAEKIVTLKNLHGLLSAYINHDKVIASHYQAILNSPSNGIELAKLIAKEADKHTKPTTSNFHDDILRIANFFSNEKNYKAFFEDHPIHGNPRSLQVLEQVVATAKSAADTSNMVAASTSSTNRLALALAGNSLTTAADNVRDGFSNREKEKVKESKAAADAKATKAAPAPVSLNREQEVTTPAPSVIATPKR
jgi:hypothetical protein